MNKPKVPPALVRLRLASFCAVLLLFTGLWLSARAEAQGISLIRDAEVEHTIDVYATPLFQAAGLSPAGIRIFLVDSKTLNAFVAGGQNLFLHTGLLMAAKEPGEVIGVIAHETGHIAGGHVAGRTDQLQKSQTGVLASYVLGLGAALATGEPALGAAVIAGGQDVALKGLLRFTRSQEGAADQSAVSYLKATEQSPEGLAAFMETLSGQEALLVENQDPYLQTHPLSQDRVAFFRRAVETSPYKDTPPDPELVRLHQRMVAKLSGFLEPKRLVLRRYPKEDRSLPARYARSIANYRANELDQALAGIDELLAEHPDDPYFHELRGQMLMENARLEEALPSYETAAAALPGATTIHLALAQVQIELDRPELNEPALQNLDKVLRKEPRNGFAWRLAATAYSRLGDQGMMTLALSESALAAGRYAEAIDRAKRAQELLGEGSVAGLQAQDVEFEADRLLKAAERE